MNCKQAKNIQITKYLSSIGIEPAKVINNNYWYYSMIRNGESDPSFKVDDYLNCWYDHGVGEGGNILHLVMKMHHLNTVSDALSHLSGQRVIHPFSFHQQKENYKNKKTSIQVKLVKKISHPSLLFYIATTRGITIEYASIYCSEIHYENNNHSYFSIGFHNDLNGWEIRNKYWKGCIGSKGITTIKNNLNECCVFEGFIDFLSFITLFPGYEDRFDFLILNSTANSNKAASKLCNYTSVHLYLDNDNAGREGFKKIRATCNNCIDHSYLYKSYVDLNDYLLKSKGDPLSI